MSISSKLKHWLHKELPSPVVARAEKMTQALHPRDGKLGPCPACATHQRAVVGSLFELKEKTLDPKPVTLTVAVLLCRECGLVHLFESSAIGL